MNVERSRRFCVFESRSSPHMRRLRGDPNNLAALYTILDDRARPYYVHRLAA